MFAVVALFPFLSSSLAFGLTFENLLWRTTFLNSYCPETEFAEAISCSATRNKSEATMLFTNKALRPGANNKLLPTTVFSYMKEKDVRLAPKSHCPHSFLKSPTLDHDVISSLDLTPNPLIWDLLFGSIWALSMGFVRARGKSRFKICESRTAFARQRRLFSSTARPQCLAISLGSTKKVPPPTSYRVGAKFLGAFSELRLYILRAWDLKGQSSDTTNAASAWILVYTLLVYTCHVRVGEEQRREAHGWRGERACCKRVQVGEA